MARKPVRRGLYQAVDVLVDRAAKIYADSTGHKMTEKEIAFIKAVIFTQIDLIDEAIEQGGELNPRMIGMLAFNRALATIGLLADKGSWTECGAAAISLALAAVDVFGVVSGAVLMVPPSGGIDLVVAAPVIFASAVYWGYQVNDVVQKCGTAYVNQTERTFAAKYNVTSKRAMMTRYGDMMCRMQEGRSQPVIKP